MDIHFCERCDCETAEVFHRESYGDLCFRCYEVTGGRDDYSVLR